MITVCLVQFSSLSTLFHVLVLCSFPTRRSSDLILRTPPRAARACPGGSRSSPPARSPPYPARQCGDGEQRQAVAQSRESPSPPPQERAAGRRGPEQQPPRPSGEPRGQVAG